MADPKAPPPPKAPTTTTARERAIAAGPRLMPIDKAKPTAPAPLRVKASYQPVAKPVPV